jgi:3-hydroxyisobutyrate dehydrogenase/2-hydroxy-3-oxopropionate reductase
MTKVAVIGLGGMGSRMAARMLATGHEVIVWNRSAGPLAALADAGAAQAASPADAARQAEVLLTVVADPDALRAVTEGGEGVAVGAHSGLTVVEMSTVGPDAVRRLRSVLPAQAGLVDAPVLGSHAEVDGGKLIVLVGGPERDRERVAPVLRLFGAVTPVGELGCGAAAKLVANAAVIDTIGALGEALALGQALGLSIEAVYQALAPSPLGAQAERRKPALESGDYPPRFPLALASKDAVLIAEAAERAGIDLPITAAAGSWLAAAEQAGAGGLDYVAVLETIRRGPAAARLDD